MVVSDNNVFDGLFADLKDTDYPCDGLPDVVKCPPLGMFIEMLERDEASAIMFR